MKLISVATAMASAVAAVAVAGPAQADTTSVADALSDVSIYNWVSDRRFLGSGDEDVAGLALDHTSQRLLITVTMAHPGAPHEDALFAVGLSTIPGVTTPNYTAIRITGDQWIVGRASSQSSPCDGVYLSGTHPNPTTVQLSVPSRCLEGATAVAGSAHTYWSEGLACCNDTRSDETPWTPFAGVTQAAVPPPPAPTPTPQPVAQRPSAPRAVYARAASRRATLYWSYPASNGGARIDRYQVRRGASSRNVPAFTRQFRFTGLVNGRAYPLSVRAHNRVGFSRWVRVVARPHAPARPAASVAPRDYPNCAALNRVYPHGVGRPGAADRTSGQPVTNFTRSWPVYRLNTESDRDRDGIACEKL